MKKKSLLVKIAIPVIAVLSALVLYQYGYLRITSELSLLEEAEALKAKALAKSIQLIEQKPQFETRLAALREVRQAENSKLIEGQTPTVAAATLQNKVKAFITGKGGTILSERVEKPEDQGPFKVISVSIDATLPDARALGDILYAIETQVPYLSVREMDTRVRNPRDPRELSVRLKVSALTGGR
jgi:Type II secretion system (T2SS), protein M subtype b